MYEVAERAGVSIATVSRVLHDSAPVAADTRRRVLEAASELQWRPSRLAQAFAKQSHGVVGIVFPDLAGPYYSRVIAGFEQAVVERASAALILGTHGRSNAEELVSDLADRVDGLVIMGRTVSDDFVDALRPLPVALLARPPIRDVPAVRAVNLSSAQAVAEHLLAHGRRHLVFVGDPERSPDVNERWRGVQRAMRHAGPDVEHALVQCGGFDVEHGYKVGLRLFDGQHTLDAVVCANDEVASGIYLAARAAGLRVPDDVAVTGWDDSPMAARLHPPLTTVRQPMRELGARAATLLFDLITHTPTKGVQLSTNLVIRSSCGCDPIEDN